MTIIQPSRYKQLASFLALFFGVLIFGGLFAVFEYNSIADLRFETSSIRGNLASLKTTNAELKNQLYQALQTGVLETLAREESLILDKAPGYMSPNKWLSAF